MKFSNGGTWFYFNDSNHDDGGVCLRSLSIKDLNRIEKETATVKREFKKVTKRDPAQVFEIREVDEEKRMQLQWDAMIVDWKNIEVDGKQIKCTTENKVMMMNEYPEFAVFVGEAITKLVDLQPTAEELEKN